MRKTKNFLKRGMLAAAVAAFAISSTGCTPAGGSPETTGAVTESVTETETDSVETDAPETQATEVPTEKQTEAPTEKQTEAPTEKQTEAWVWENKNTTETPALEGYNLLWADEFDGDTLNTDLWSMERRAAGWTNHELQEYRASTDNVFVKDGNLVLKALRGGKSGNFYSSGKVNSKNKADFTYGKVVIRAKAPEGKGLWPAGWMMPTNEHYYGQWPLCGEIDILEILGHETNKAYTTIHYGNPHAQQQGSLTLDDGDSFSDSFHEYSVEWEPGEMRFYIDDTQTLVCNDWYSVDGKFESPYPAPFDQKFYVQLNLAVGGDWPGDPDETTDFDNAEFLIDYVRVYQKPEYDTNVSRPEVTMREPNANGNYINNSNFSDAAENLNDNIDWQFLTAQGGEAEASIHDNMIEIKTANEGDVDYSVQLVSWDIPMIKGERYRIEFDAMASAPRDISTCISAPNADWARYFNDTTLSLTTDWHTYSYEFEMTSQDDPSGRLEFNMGHLGSDATVYITYVSVKKISD